MMSVISNSCVAGYWYKFYNVTRNHPFIWTSINEKDFFYLINNFYTIDFTKFKVVKGIDKFRNKFKDNPVFLTREKNNELNDTCSIVIDNKIVVGYFHFINSHNGKTYEGKNYGTDLYTPNIVSFITKKYTKYLPKLIELQKDKLDVKFVNTTSTVENITINKNIILLPNSLGYTKSCKYITDNIKPL